MHWSSHRIIRITLPITSNESGSDRYATGRSFLFNLSTVPNLYVLPSPLSTHNAPTDNVPDTHKDSLSNSLVNDPQSGSLYFLKPRQLLSHGSSHEGAIAEVGQ